MIGPHINSTSLYRAFCIMCARQIFTPDKNSREELNQLLHMHKMTAL